MKPVNRSRTIVLSSVVLYLFLYLPLVVVAASSFNASRFGREWEGFTFHWYRMALANPQVIAALKNTLLLGLCSTAIATLLGTLLGYGLARHRFPGERFAARFMLFPIAIPDIVLAVALLLFYAMTRELIGLFHLGMGTMIIAHITFQVPFVALVIRARCRGLDLAIEEAAADLGASRWQRLWHVTLPMLRPGIAAGALLAFTLSLDDFVVSFFTSGPGSTTVPIYIYAAVKRGVTAEIHALSSLLILAAIIGTIGVTFLQSRNKNASSK